MSRERLNVNENNDWIDNDYLKSEHHKNNLIILELLKNKSDQETLDIILNQKEKDELWNFIYKEWNPMYENYKLKLWWQLQSDAGYDSKVFFLILKDCPVKKLNNKTVTIKSYFNGFDKTRLGKYIVIQELFRKKLHDSKFIESVVINTESELLSIQNNRLHIYNMPLDIIGEPLLIEENKYWNMVWIMPYIWWANIAMSDFGDIENNVIISLIEEVLRQTYMEVTWKSLTLVKRFLWWFENIKVVNWKIIITDIWRRIIPFLERI